MAKTESTFINMLLVLTVISAIAGVALGYVNSITISPIAQAQATKEEDAIRQVAPDFDNAPLAEQQRVAMAPGDTLVVYPAKKQGQVVGAAVKTSELGFGGEIRLMVGFDADGTIRNYIVLQHAETPGLGSKMDSWFSKEGKGSIIGKNPAVNNLTVSKDKGEIDAITASTITSRSFLRAVQKAYFAYMNKEVPTDVLTSATSGATTKGSEVSTNSNE